MPHSCVLGLSPQEGWMRYALCSVLDALDVLDYLVLTKITNYEVLKNMLSADGDADGHRH